MTTYNVMCRVSGGVTGTRQALWKQGGLIVEFESREAAESHAATMMGQTNGPNATCRFEYWAVPSNYWTNKPLASC